MSVPADRINLRTATPAAIRRAMRRARRELESLLRDVDPRLAAMMGETVRRIQEGLAGLVGADGRIPASAMAQVRATLDEALRSQRAQYADALRDGLEAAARTTVGSMRGAPAVADRAVAFVRRFQAADGLRLSDRLWRVDRGARELLGRAVEGAIVRGESAYVSAQRLLREGLEVPAHLRLAMQGAQLATLQAGVAGALVTGQGNALYNATRLMRTEMARASTEAFVGSIADHPDIVGVRFTLSPLHPEPDICDMHAEVNLYGLGAGVYPLGKHPFPAHPNTISFLQPVFRDEVPAEAAQKVGRLEWLQKQPPAKLASILGQRKAAALQAGWLKESQIGTPWYVLRERYAKQGLDVMGLEQGAGLALARPKPPGILDATSPVSAALAVATQKRRTGHVLDIIDDLHRDGALPLIPVNGYSGTKYSGAYHFYPRTGDAFEIKLRNYPGLELTFAHELGHFLDHHGIGSRGRFASVRSSIMDEWRSAAMASPQIQQLQRLLRETTSTRDRAYFTYLLETEEIWARSYAQWVATRSADPLLLSQLRPLQLKPSQWMDAEFEPIGAAIDALFRRLGWRP